MTDRPDHLSDLELFLSAASTSEGDVRLRYLAKARAARYEVERRLGDAVRLLEAMERVEGVK